MGCDIHTMLEVDLGGPQWQCETKVTHHEDDDGYLSIEDAPYNGRNYDLFAMMAGVRNGRGFAGCDTGDGFTPISIPRGVPDTCSKEFREYSEQWDSDGHSHSWLTIDDIIHYDWSQRTKKRGWVDAYQYAWFKHIGRPEKGYCGGVSGGLAEHITSQEMERRLVDAAPTLGQRLYEPDSYSAQMKHTYCAIEWKVAYHEQATNFLAHTVFGKMLPLMHKHNVTMGDVRIVFLFDN